MRLVFIASFICAISAAANQAWFWAWVFLILVALSATELIRENK